MSKTTRGKASRSRTPAPRPPAELIEDMARQVRQALADALLHLNLQGEADATALTVERAACPVAPARLARAHPGGAAAQAQARELYERCLDHYRKVVRAHDAALPVDDVGAAVAYFVAANLQALHGIAATPAMLLQLERQLGGVAQRSAAWASAPACERQAYFEQMALLGVLVSESSRQAAAQGPAAIANVHRAARGYLQQLLGLNPDQLTLDAAGLTLRGARVDSSGSPVDGPR
jgi:uncharacterized protein DUF6683